MAVKKISNLNEHSNPSTNENEFDIENYLNANWNTIIDVVDNNADELSTAQTDIASLQTDNETNKTNIESLQTDNTTNKTNITNLQTDNTTNKTDIANIKEKNTEQDTKITNLTADTNIDISTVVLTEAVTKETNYQLPLNYIVGNKSLTIFWNGVLLFEGDDGNYKENGTSSEQSNIVQFGWDLEVGDILTVEVRGVENEE